MNLDRAHSLTRNRANSYDTASPHHHNEPGPLAHLPSSDPDHIDGLQSQDSSSLSHGNSGSNLLPPLNLTDISNFSDSPLVSPSETGKPNPNMPYTHPNMNASAPTLSLMHPADPNTMHRAATTPNPKKITFAANLAVYDTFSAIAYDRRSEPATCNRLTPALAQRIKEELNSYKMEEMEVHTASRAQYVPALSSCLLVCLSNVYNNDL